MAQSGQRKCLCCGKVFDLDHRNRKRQRFCSTTRCRCASKAASQAAWLAQPQNSGYFRDPVHVTRVQAWRAAHPGYGSGKFRQVRLPLPRRGAVPLQPPLQHARHARLPAARPGLGREAPARQQLAFEGREVALAHRVVVGSARRSHRDPDLRLLAAKPKGDRDVLRVVAVLMHDLFRFSMLGRHVENSKHQFCSQMPGQRPAHDPSVERIAVKDTWPWLLTRTGAPKMGFVRVVRYLVTN